MHEANANASIDHRRGPRSEFEGRVTLRFELPSVAGEGRNIAEQGVYLTTAQLPVTVEIEGHDHPIAGHLLRVESLGEGRFGIAVRFVEALR